MHVHAGTDATAAFPGPHDVHAAEGDAPHREAVQDGGRDVAEDRVGGQVTGGGPAPERVQLFG